jgi:hypothetical protein
LRDPPGGKPQFIGRRDGRYLLLAVLLKDVPDERGTMPGSQLGMFFFMVQLTTSWSYPQAHLRAPPALRCAQDEIASLRNFNAHAKFQRTAGNFDRTPAYQFISPRKKAPSPVWRHAMFDIQGAFFGPTANAAASVPIS